MQVSPPTLGSWINSLAMAGRQNASRWKSSFCLQLFLITGNKRSGHAIHPGCQREACWRPVLPSSQRQTGLPLLPNTQLPLPHHVSPAKAVLHFQALQAWVTHQTLSSQVWSQTHQHRWAFTHLWALCCWITQHPNHSQFHCLHAFYFADSCFQYLICTPDLLLKTTDTFSGVICIDNVINICHVCSGD